MKNLKAKLALVGASVGASFGSFAADHSALITAAGTDGETNVGAAITVILTIAAIMTGVGIVYRLLTK